MKVIIFQSEIFSYNSMFLTLMQRQKQMKKVFTLLHEELKV